MMRLPVPPLAQTLERYLDAVRPLLDDAEYETTRRCVADFADGDGPACQEALLRFADEEDAAGRTWLSEDWLSVYLRVRSPLPLTTSVGFQIDWPAPGSGVARAADVVHRLAAVHLQYLRGETEPQVGSRGEPLCMEQWRALAGGIRHPGPVEDRLLPGDPTAANREIVVLRAGRAYALGVSDAAGAPLPRPALETALRRILEAADPAADEPSHAGAPDAVPFAAWSYLGGELAADYHAAAMTQGANARTYERLTQAVFCVNLVEEPADTDTHLVRTAVGFGAAWAHKPLTYQVGLLDDFVGLHMEHSWIDGATVKSIVALAQAVEPVDGAGPAPTPAPLRWVLPDDLAARLGEDIDAYRRRAAAQRGRTVSVPTMPARDIPMKLSQDACQQFVMLYAQLRTHGRLRSTYESVDMRAYRAGRTETLRPNTVQAVAFVRALIDGDATLDGLRAAFDAHRTWVRWCKSGQGIDRHLFGLRAQARRLSLRPAIFADEGYRRLVTDFVSTTSVGDPYQLVRYAFAPTSPGGIGMSYFAVDGEFDFFLSYGQEAGETIDDFADALVEGTAALWRLVATAAQDDGG